MMKTLTKLSLVMLSVAALACQGDRVVRFAAVVPLSGEYQLYGQAVKKGVELAFEELVTREDIGYELELSVVDSEGDPDKAAALLEEQYKNGALAVIGGVTSAEALQMVPAADRFDRILLSPSATNPQLTGISKNFYRVIPTDAREGTTMGNFATQKLKITTAVILAKEDVYARGVQEVFKAEFERNGGQVLDLVEFPAGSSEFSGLIDRILTVKPDAVYLAAFAPDIQAIITELRSRGFDKYILTTSAFASPEAIEQLGDPAEGVFLTQAVFDTDSEDPTVSGFVTKYRDKYGLTPDLYSAHGYDAVMILAEGLIQGGPLANDFWKGIRSIRDFEGVTGTIQFDERGDVQKFPRVYVINNGDLVDYEAEIERKRQELLERLRELEQGARRN